MAPNQKRTGFRFPWGGDRREDEELPAVPAPTMGAPIGTVLVEHRSRPAPISVPARPVRIDEGDDDIGPGPFDVTADDDLASAEDDALDEAERAEELEAAEALAEEEAVREALSWPQNDLAAKLSRKAAEDAETAAAIAAAEAAAESFAVDEAVALAQAAEDEAAALATAAAGEDEAEPDAAPAPEDGTWSADAAVAEAESRTAAATDAEAVEPEPEPVVDAESAVEIAAEAAAEAAPPPIVVEPGPAFAAVAAPAREPRRDNPLVANLVRAMRDAAAVARDEALAKVRADATIRVDEIRSRSTTRSVQLRRRSEEDVAAIKDWAKAEIARIRAEADDRIVGRKARLAREVEAHAEQTEHRLAEVDAVVATFEAEMATFFDALLAENDPTHLAALAERMPEAPAYAELPDLGEEPAWTPPAPGESTRAFRPGADVGTGDGDGEGDGEGQGPRGRRSRKRSTTSDDDLAPLDVSETELEDADEPAATTGTATEISADIAAILSDEETLAALNGLAAVEAMSRTAADAAIRAEMDAAEAAESAKRAEEEAADAAEAARRAEAASRPELDPHGDPFESDAEGGAPFGVAIESQTRVLVSGLGSIAAISAFKVALTGLPGVTSVNVTAAVDGEFVYSVTHAEYVDLRPLLARLPGFTVTLRSDEGGILRVDASEVAA